MKNIKLVLKNKLILNDVSIHLPKNKITTFIGKSGAGKTSLLKCLAQLHKHYDGEILCNGVPLKMLSTKQRAQAIGFVFQQFHLFPHMTVLQNCVQPQITSLGLSSKQATSKALSWLESVGLIEHKDVYPNKLSGGQQQRVAIVRALVLEPKVLLFDEPSSALDPQSTKELATLLQNLNMSGVTIGLCSHDISFVKSLMDKVYLLDGGCVIDELDGDLDKASSIGRFLEI